MKYIFAISLIISTGCSEDSLQRFCPNKCWAIPGVSEGIIKFSPSKSHIGVGPCRAGTPVCDEDFNIIECNNEILPSSEICDNIDNNCNGKIDEQANGQPLTNHIDDSCSNLGVCRGIFSECRSGRYICQYPNDYEQNEISCDNKDNDCDGLIDENLFIDEFCYDVPAEEWYTATNPPCHPGIYQCVRGEKTCVGQVLPSSELCDLIDNDCNGIVDDTGETLETDYDIVFIIDDSGSMCDEIEAVGVALNTYVSQFAGNEFFRFALVLMAHSPDPKVVVDVPFGDLTTIQSRLLSMGCSGSAAEASLDSMEMVCNENDPLGLEWRDSADRLFFAFTDETDQSDTIPSTTPQDVISACLDSWTLPFVWGWGSSNFPYVCDNASGKYFILSDRWEVIFDDLSSIIVTLCGV